MKGLTLICFSSPIIVQAQDNPSDLVKREGLGTSTQSGIEFNGAYSGNRRVTVRGLDAPLEEVLGMMFGLGDKMADNLNDRDRLIYFATKETINDRRFVFAEITDFCRFVLALDTSTDNSIFASDVADRLLNVQDLERQHILNNYDNMLSKLTPEGAEYIENFVYKLRLKTVSNVPDFIKESEMDPEGFMERRTTDCQKV
jgi:hypothetical protein